MNYKELRAFINELDDDQLEMPVMVYVAADECFTVVSRTNPVGITDPASEHGNQPYLIV